MQRAGFTTGIGARAQRGQQASAEAAGGIFESRGHRAGHRFVGQQVAGGRAMPALDGGEAAEYLVAGEQPGVAGTVDHHQLPVGDMGRTPADRRERIGHVDAISEQRQQARSEPRVGDVLAERDADAGSPVQATRGDADTRRRDRRAELAAGLVPGGD